ncbi:pilus assembly protein [Noviherbaspirillum massiliense]|uniref:pilus assembly protein n=1 Tax=Noviherbaspirillum massiliense TaxID=1465823 RepID=UPI00030D1166|nr:PilC/PilY family type IV pilus protein [Noviherbaspirillum massiliense]
MNKSFISKLLTLALCLGLLAAPLQSGAEDIDIFTGASGGTSINANVLIILDNTSNWSAAKQHWPEDGGKQGLSELKALQTVVAGLGSNVNLGLMMFTPNGSGNAGGYVRSAVVPMTDDNKTIMNARIQTIIDNFQSSSEKAASNANYGNALFDAFKYFGGYTKPANSKTDTAGSPLDKTHFGPAVFNDLTPVSMADQRAYTDSTFRTYLPPGTVANICARNYIIFIGNGFPNADEKTWLSNVGGDTTELRLTNYVTKTTVVGDPVNLGQSSACYVDAASCGSSGFPDYPACTDGTYSTCSCLSSSANGAGCSKVKGSNTFKFTVQGINTVTTLEPSGTYLPSGSTARTADEWANFLADTDMNSATGQQNATMFTIDVYKDAQDANQTALLRSMADYGGGKYYAATSKDLIIKAMKEILAEIQAVNTTFASTSLPVNATNRTQNENQVFIGMFRPDADAKPRWFGNLKRYQLINSAGSIELGDVDGVLATNTLTGFVTNCATSYWTKDSGTYWQNVTMNPSPAGGCTTTAYSPYSDAPDGPQVEKGGTAEVIRQGNNPPGTATNPSWQVNRTIYTENDSALTAFDTSSSGLSSDLVDFLKGYDLLDENRNNVRTDTRVSVHGDVVHSRPLPVNYGGTKGVTVYYGANDGTLRAVDAATGKERWAFVAREFFPRLSRLKDNSPLVNYPSLLPGVTPTPTPKDYFFDGTTGIYQNADNTTVWIYPTTRRGGRMIYALDVSDPASPVFKWKVGCPNLTDDTGCTTGMSAIGQTWSAPNLAFIKGFSDNTPLILVGGGYDNCEDVNSSSPSCESAKGRVIYALNGNTGELIRAFTTERSVVGDVSYADIDGDGHPDYAYAADTGGNLYRISFIDMSNTSGSTALASNEWTITKIAYTSGAGRKFLFRPEVLSNSKKVYIAIGSGDREHPLQSHYPYASSVVNRFYVYVDDPASNTVVNLDDTSKMYDYTSDTTCNTTPVLPGSRMKGWFMSLDQYGRGEQVVTSALIASGMVTFSTNRPIVNSNQCSTILGEAGGYWVNLLNGSGAIGVTGNCGGTRRTTFVGGGLPPSPVLATGVPIDGRPTTVVLGAARRGGGASVTINPQEVKPTISSRRKRTYSATSTDN